MFGYNSRFKRCATDGAKSLRVQRLSATTGVKRKFYLILLCHLEPEFFLSFKHCNFGVNPFAVIVFWDRDILHYGAVNCLFDRGFLHSGDWPGQSDPRKQMKLVKWVQMSTKDFYRARKLNILQIISIL